MTLTPGTRLGPYEVLAPLGAGGMGEVYKANDTRLDRLVAIKVLPSHLSENPEFKQRFEREARAISQLSHPHICALYDVGNAEGTEYLVMELLEGQTLADRVEKGALPAEQLLKIGVEIADALDRAHRAGIVHRDLKPGNIMLTKSGVKLLDFGLARVTPAGNAAPDLSSLPTQMDRPLTEKGSVMGTFQYMAPEQFEGSPADARTDIFAFGCVLYEMATGRKAFTGKSQASLLTAIMSSDPPPISSIQPLTPAALERVVKTCLAKDPEDRWQNARDLKSELQWIAQTGSQAGGAPPSGVRRARKASPSAFLAAGAALAAIFFAAAYFRSRSTPLPVIRSSILPPEKTRFSFAGDNAGPPTISPDGKNIAFVATGEGRPIIYVRALSGLTATPLPGTDDATFPFWSADGRTIGFFSQGKLKRVDVGKGGGVATICNAPNSRGGSWNRDGVIIFTPETRDAIYRVAASGGTPAPVTKIAPDSQTTHRWPVFLPDGKHFLYFAGNHNDARSEQSGIWFASLDGKKNLRVVHTLAGALYSSGYLIFLRDDVLLAQPFDPDSGRLSGEAASLAEGSQFDLSTWHGAFSVSEGNVLAYQPGTAANANRLFWYGRTGKSLGALGESNNYVGAVRIAPDGRRVAVGIGDPGDLHVVDIASGVKTRLTFVPSTTLAPAWSPNGDRIAFSSTRKNGRFGLFVKASNGALPEETLIEAQPGAGYIVNDWSRDGRFIAHVKNVPAQPRHLWLFPIGGDRKPFELLSEHDGDETEASFSPDSRWIAYQTFTSGAPTIIVSPVPGPGGKWQVSTGGYNPRWRSDGREIYYIAPDLTLMAVQVDGSGTEFRVGPSTPLFHTRALSNPTYGYDATSDGQRFLINSLENETAAPINLVLNWQAELPR